MPQPEETSYLLTPPITPFILLHLHPTPPPSPTLVLTLTLKLFLPQHLKTRLSLVNHLIRMEKIEANNLVEIEHHQVAHHRAMILLAPEKEACHHVDLIW